MWFLFDISMLCSNFFVKFSNKKIVKKNMFTRQQLSIYMSTWNSCLTKSLSDNSCPSTCLPETATYLLVYLTIVAFLQVYRTTAAYLHVYLTTALTAAFIPCESPPLVNTAIPFPFWEPRSISFRWTWRIWNIEKKVENRE